MSKQVLNDLDFMSAARIVNLPDPVAAQQPATKAYVDSAVEGLAWKDSCRAASTANINLASPGANIDGIAMVANDRFLAKDQTAGAENGIYIWNGAAVAATRALDMNSAVEVEQAITTVEEGTSAGATFRQTAVNVTLNTTSLAWTSFGAGATAASTGTAGVAALATQAEVDAGAVTNKIVTPATLASWSNRLRKFAADVGDGSATQYTFSHNFATFDIQVEVFRNSGNRDSVVCDVDRTSTNAVRLTFVTPVAAAAYRVVVIG